MITISFDREDLICITDHLRIAQHTVEHHIKQANDEGDFATAMAMRHDLDELEAILAQLEGMEEDL